VQKLLLVSSYLAILGLGFGGGFLNQKKVIPAQDYSIFSIQPPSAVELRSLASLKSILAPDKETVLEVTGDMALAHVNKVNALPASFVPPNLTEIKGVKTFGKEYARADILPFFFDLATDAQKSGYSLSVVSAYRSYFDQEKTFLNWVKSVGWEISSLVSARPGHSEHQLGTTIDVGLSNPGFDTFRASPAALWVEQNSWRFGFVVSYPKGKEQITGYVHEPWHLRWVGIELATKLYQQELTLEEYLSR